MANLASYLQNSQINRNKTFSQAEFGALLNAFEDAAFVFEKNINAILLANNQFLELSLFTNQELIGKTMQVLFEKYSPDQMLAGEYVRLSLKRFGKEIIPVRVKFIDLDFRGGYYLAIVTLDETQRQDTSEFWEEFTNGVQRLTQLTESTDLPSSLDSAVAITKKLLDADIVSIYSANSDYPSLIKKNTIDPTGQLPNTLPSTDLSRLAEFSIWLPGQRVITYIHKFSRNQELSYLASVPLGQNNAYHGLLAVGSLSRKPGKYLSVLLGIIGANISSVLSRHIYTSNIRLWMEDKQKTLSLMDFLFENTQEGIIVLNPDLTIQEVNPAIEVMFGYKKKEITNQPVTSLLVNADAIFKACDSAIRGMPTLQIGNITLHHRDGGSLMVQARVTPLLDKGILRKIVIFINDVSEHEKVVLKAQQLEHRAFVGEFTSVFAHEVRNPLNNLSSGVQLLIRKLKPDDPNLAILRRVEVDCDRLEHLMESFLSFSKTFDTSRLEILEIIPLVQRVFDKENHRFIKARVQTVFTHGNEHLKVRGDQRSLERVFINLFTNAVAAMEKVGGVLSVKVALSNVLIDTPQVEIIVSDSGPGIPDEIKKHLFEPFVTTKEQGTGLGLSITKKIITDHRGSIRFDSFPGGTIFYIYLPAYSGDIS